MQNIDSQIADWTVLLRQYLNSRHALVGLARLYRAKAGLTHNSTFARAAANLYAQAARLAIQNGHIRYTSDLADLYVSLGNKHGLDNIFTFILAQPNDMDPVHYYQGLVDYAHALDLFQDTRAATYFQQAVTFGSVDKTFAADLYAQYLLAHSEPHVAYRILDTTLTREQRLRAIWPVFLRRQAAQAAGLSTASAASEVDTLKQMFTNDAVGAILRITTTGETSAAAAPAFAHNNASDDCRNAALRGKPVYTVKISPKVTYYFWAFVVNLAEVEYNEAGPGTPWGAVDAVGWTTRSRVFENVCPAAGGGVDSVCAKDNKCAHPGRGAAFDGGCGWHTAQSCKIYPACEAVGPCTELPCGQTGHCAISKNYCCGDHGGTHALGASQNQFNDAHVDTTTLWNSGYLGAATYLLWGYLPDMSVKLPTGKYWTAGGVKPSSCTFNCSAPICHEKTRDSQGPPPAAAPVNLTVASPHGPMEYRRCPWYSPSDPSVEYEPSDPSLGWAQGNVCGGGNCFANRCTTYECTGP